MFAIKFKTLYQSRIFCCHEVSFVFYLCFECIVDYFLSPEIGLYIWSLYQERRRA